MIIVGLNDVGARAFFVEGLHPFQVDCDFDFDALAGGEVLGFGKANKLDGGLLDAVFLIVIGIRFGNICLDDIRAIMASGIGDGLLRDQLVAV